MSENVVPGLVGIYRDVLRDQRGAVVHDSGWKRNRIVTSFRVLLAAFVRNDGSEDKQGIVHMAVGQGEESWDQGVDAPEETMTALVTPHSPPIEDLEIEYLDDTYVVQEDASPRLQITATLPPSYPPALPGLNTYPLREFGLFGRLGGGDNMLNSIRHPVIHKNEASTLIRVVRLYF